MAMIKKSIAATVRQSACLHSLSNKDVYASDNETEQKEIIREALIEAEIAMEIKGCSQKSVKDVMVEVL